MNVDPWVYLISGALKKKPTTAVAYLGLLAVVDVDVGRCAPVDKRIILPALFDFRPKNAC